MPPRTPRTTFAVLAVALAATAAPAAAAPPDRAAAGAELFASNNTAVITDPFDPRLQDPLTGFARQVSSLVAEGGATARGSELLDGVFFDAGSGETTFERSRRFDVARADPGELRAIAGRVAARFDQSAVLTFDDLRPGDPAADAVELEVPGVTAEALRAGLVADPDAAARLFGGSVTLDGRLLLVADAADLAVARAFAAALGGDLDRATVRPGDREFVGPDATAPIEVHGRTLEVALGDGDDALALRAGRDRVEVDLGGDGSVEFASRRGELRRVRVGGAGASDRVRLTAAGRAALRVDERAGDAVVGGDVLDVALAGVERLDLAADGGVREAAIGDLAGTGLQEVHGPFERTVARGTENRDVVDVLASGGELFVLGLPVLVQVQAAGPATRLEVQGRGGDDQLSGSGLRADAVRLALDGGEGSDVLLGGQGDDELTGRGGFDDVTGGRGDDAIDLGASSDRAQWAPGDGDDRVDGGRASTDSVFVRGGAEAERLELSRDGRGTVLRRDADGSRLTLDDVEEVDAILLGGADTVALGDLRGTATRLVDVSLAPAFGAPGGDGLADRVVVTGTARRDALTVTGSGTTARVGGLTAAVNVSHAEGALDVLQLDTGAGADTVDTTGLAAGVIGLDVR